jgi:DNA-binding NarL/FixJ family response regulator
MKKILIIEDQPQMRRNIATILEMEGFEVACAEHGRQGIELAQSGKPDLILCDVMMPEADGYGVLQALRDDKATATIPFVFLTAKGEKTDQRAGMNLGADDYLTKPVSKNDLLAAIEARFARQRTHEAHLQEQLDQIDFTPNFDSPIPLQALGLTPREAEVLLWVAQGKSNADIATILGMAEKTVKKHMGNMFEKLGLESRNAATVRALELLSKPSGKT